jgi:demethylmenaquinone methyltransferase/2-methoxy-6-polyprenyl-1,4-benzoquinol methylase
MSVGDRIATAEGKRQYVRTLFDRIADRYDFITVFLSYGLDRRWKRALVRLASPLAGARALDLATGTGGHRVPAAGSRRSRRRPRRHAADDPPCAGRRMPMARVGRMQRRCSWSPT